VSTMTSTLPATIHWRPLHFVALPENTKCRLAYGNTD
jgi:hypothetical protein